MRWDLHVEPVTGTVLDKTQHLEPILQHSSAEQYSSASVQFDARALKVQQPVSGATPKCTALPLFQWPFHDESD